SWYCEPAAERLAEYYSQGGDNKFEGFERFRADFPALPPYRYWLIADDDVYFSPGDISRFFALCDCHGAWLAQRALRWTTNFNHKLTLCNPICILRRVTFVEVMAPCFSAAALADLGDTFLLTKSTWGIDWAWAARTRGKGAIHVIDAVRVEHT